MSPTPGILEMFCVEVFCSSPASAKLSPLPRSTVVSPDRQRRDAEPADRDRVGEVQLADLGLDVQADMLCVDDRRGKIESDTELLVLDRDRRKATRARLRDRNRDFAADKETRRLPRCRGQVRFR